MVAQFDWPLSLADLQKWAIPAIGAVAACLTLYVGRLLVARRSRAPRRPAIDSGVDPFAFGSPSERRRSVRRKGAPVRVAIAQDQHDEELLEGWVINRSMGGLCLLVNKPVPIGSSLRVRSLEYRDTDTWSDVEVVTCHPNGNDWELGCRFVKTPPWVVLLTFG